jgi:hypothetical protein
MGNEFIIYIALYNLLPSHRHIINISILWFLKDKWYVVGLIPFLIASWYVPFVNCFFELTSLMLLFETRLIDYNMLLIMVGVVLTLKYYQYVYNNSSVQNGKSV